MIKTGITVAIVSVFVLTMVFVIQTESVEAKGINSGVRIVTKSMGVIKAGPGVVSSSTTEAAPKTVWQHNQGIRKIFKGQKVLILGDSISYNYGKYPEVAVRLLGGTVTNRSANGKTIAYVPGKGSKTNSVWHDVRSHSFYKSNSYRKHKIIIIAAGTNDYAWNTKEKSISPSKTTQDARTIIKMLRSNNNDSKIIFITPIRRWNIDRSEKKDLEIFRTAIKNAAKGYKNIIIVNGTDITKADEISGYQDSVHPKQDYAKQVIALRLAREIQKTTLSMNGSASVKRGKAIKLTAGPVPATKTGSKASVTWRSTQPGIATVNAQGVVRGKKKGRTTIVAIAKGSYTAVGKRIITVK